MTETKRIENEQASRLPLPGRARTTLERLGPMPPLDQMLKIREDPEAYSYLCLLFMPTIVGVNRWKRAAQFQEGIRGVWTTKDDGGQPVITESSEAFALLVLENYYERWKAEWENDNGNRQGGGQMQLPKPKFMDNGPDSGKFSGWEKATKQYNRYHRRVRAERTEEEYQDQREQFLLTFELKYDEMAGPMKKKDKQFADANVRQNDQEIPLMDEY